MAMTPKHYGRSRRFTSFWNLEICGVDMTPLARLLLIRVDCSLISSTSPLANLKFRHSRRS